MSEKIEALTELATPPRAKGGTRATLALLLSLAAAGLSGATYYLAVVKGAGANGADVAAEEIAALQGRVADAEKKQVFITHELASLRDELKAAPLQAARAPSTVSAPADTAAAAAATAEAVGGLVASLKSIEGKIEDVSRDTADVQSRVAENLAAKSNALAAYVALEAIRRKLGQGADIGADVHKLESYFTLGSGGAAALTALAQAALQPGVDDRQLMEEFQPLIAEILAREKLARAESVLDKLSIQMQKLVTIRPKDGRLDESSAAAGTIDSLRKAMKTQRWHEAGALAESLKGFAVKEYPAWLGKLQQRVAAEEAVDTLQDLAMRAFAPDASAPRSDVPQAPDDATGDAAAGNAAAKAKGAP